MPQFPKKDLELLSEYLESSSSEVSVYIDLRNGSIIPSDMLEHDEDGELPEDLQTNLIYIVSIGSKYGFEDMELFIETLQDDTLKASLSDAIRHRKPFYNFKHVLSAYPEIHQWHKFQHQRRLQRAVQWLEDKDFTIVGD